MPIRTASRKQSCFRRAISPFDAIARCEATGSKVVTDGEQAKERFAMSPMHGLTNITADGMPMPCADGRHALCLLTTLAGGEIQQRF
jgi:5-methyltetrahydropteroyltriglutamate--homocysteine methyltransferase